MNGLDIMAGAFCLVSGFTVGVREIVLSPRMGSWPDAGPAVRSAMFLVMLAFTYRGFELISFGMTRDAATCTVSGVLAFASLALYNTTLAWNVLRQVLPPHVWDRLKRVNGLAFCPPRGRLALLALAGVKVLPPRAKTADLLNLEEVDAGRDPPRYRRWF